MAFARIRAEVIRLVGSIPRGMFSTYGSIAIHLNVAPRHVAMVLSHLTDEEAASLPWHRVVGTDARISPNMAPKLARKQRRLLDAEGMKVDARGRIRDDESHFHVLGPRRDIHWSEADHPLFGPGPTADPTGRRGGTADLWNRP